MTKSDNIEIARSLAATLNSTGKELRLRRLLGPSGRLLGITADHWIAHGVLPGIVDLKKTLEEVFKGEPDSITLQKGQIHLVNQLGSSVSVIMKSTSYSPYHRATDYPTATVHEALRVGADAVSVGVMIGGEDQGEQVALLGRMGEAADQVGLPLVAHIYPRGAKIENPEDRAKNVAYCARLGGELGVDIIKTEWPGSAEAFSLAVDSAGDALVAVAGGSPGNALEDYLTMTAESLGVGGAGVTFGRFVWDHDDPAMVVRALRRIVHEDAAVGDVLQG